MKKFTPIAFIFFIFFFSTSYAQFSTVWGVYYQHTIDPDFSNESRKVITDASGNAYVLADVTSNIDPNGFITTSTFHYTVISKYSTAGALIASKNINVINHVVNGFNNKGAFGLEMDFAGNLYIGFITFSATTGFDVNISKYNQSLVRLWNRRFNPTTSDVGVDMGINPGGDAYAIVQSAGANIEYHIIEANAQVTNDTSLYTFTANTDVLNAIAVKGNAIYATGYRTISGVKNVLTVKLNGQGNLKWQRVFNGGAAGDDFGKAIAVDADGDVYVTGTSDQGPPTDNDVIVMKLENSNGLTIWLSYADYNNSTTDGGLLIEAPDMYHVYVGSTSGTNVLLDKISIGIGVPSGRLVYQPIPVSPYVYLSGATLTDLKISTNYGFYLTGSALATDSLGRLFSASYLTKYVIASPDSRDAFIKDSEMPVEGDFLTSRAGVSMAFDYSKDDIYWLFDLISDYGGHNSEMSGLYDLDIATPIRKGNDAEGATINEGDILIYPNPASQEFTIHNSQFTIKEIEISDITGKIILLINNNNKAAADHSIDVSALTSGIYICRIISDEGAVTKKLVIE